MNLSAGFGELEAGMSEKERLPRDFVPRNDREGQKMTKVKDEVIKMIRRMPEKADIDDIMEELYFRKKVEAGIEELTKGKGVSHREAKKHLKKWLS